MPRRPLALAALLSLVFFIAPAQSARPAFAAGSNWTTYHHDNSRSGFDPSTPAFNGSSFGQWSASVTGNVYAEPLIYNGVVYVATEVNRIFALDEASGAVLWSTGQLGTPVTSGLPCGNINPSGITGTPVIDTANGLIYAVGEIQSPHQYLMWAVSITSHTLAWSVPLTPAGFDPSAQGERGALALGSGQVYVTFGGRAGDCGTYHPWVMSVTTAAPHTLTANAIVNTATMNEAGA